MMAGRFAGVGGFVNIAQSAKRLVFCCTLRAGDLAVEMADGGLRIVQEGKHAKFVQRVQQVCFHGPTAVRDGRQVLYVTERAVFELTPQGPALVELAPGIDLQRDVLDRMEFAPVIQSPRMMPSECFQQPRQS
jgi:propionate CoA-transferase